MVHVIEAFCSVKLLIALLCIQLVRMVVRWLLKAFNCFVKLSFMSLIGNGVYVPFEQRDTC